MHRCTNHTFSHPPYPPISSISSFKAWPLCSVTSRAAIRSLTSASSFEQPPCPCPPSSEASQQSWKAGRAAAMSEVGGKLYFKKTGISFFPYWIHVKIIEACPESTRYRKTWKEPRPLHHTIQNYCTHQDEDGQSEHEPTNSGQADSESPQAWFLSEATSSHALR